MSIGGAPILPYKVINKKALQIPIFNQYKPYNAKKGQSIFNQHRPYNTKKGHVYNGKKGSYKKHYYTSSSSSTSSSTTTTDNVKIKYVIIKKVAGVGAGYHNHHPSKHGHDIFNGISYQKGKDDVAVDTEKNNFPTLKKLIIRQKEAEELKNSQNSGIHNTKAKKSSGMGYNDDYMEKKFKEREKEELIKPSRNSNFSQIKAAGLSYGSDLEGRGNDTEEIKEGQKSPKSREKDEENFLRNEEGDGQEQKSDYDPNPSSKLEIQGDFSLEGDKSDNGSPKINNNYDIPTIDFGLKGDSGFLPIFFR
ncbi:unnamed protein product [Gordionus sp. m RMFG-2023]